MPLLKSSTDLLDFWAKALLVAKRDCLNAFLAELPSAAACARPWHTSPWPDNPAAVSDGVRATGVSGPLFGGFDSIGSGVAARRCRRGGSTGREVMNVTYPIGACIPCPSVVSTDHELVRPRHPLHDDPPVFGLRPAVRARWGVESAPALGASIPLSRRRRKHPPSIIRSFFMLHIIYGDGSGAGVATKAFRAR